MRAVVVVFPFVPVMAMTWTSQRRSANSISPMSSLETAVNATAMGQAVSIPGLMTVRSKGPVGARAASQQVRVTPKAANFATAGASLSALPLS